MKGTFMNGFRISKRRVSTAAVVSGVLFVGLLAAAVLSSSAGASGGGLHRAPGGKLTNGEAVIVTGRNLNPGDEIVLVQCLMTATNLTGCDPATATMPTAVSATGRLPATTVTVATGNISTGTCGTSKIDAAYCMIAAQDLSSPTTLTSFVAYVNITFAKPVATTTTSLAIPTTLPSIPTSLPSIPTSLPSIPITIPSLPTGTLPTLSVRQ
jgi:hypothetical protein